MPVHSRLATINAFASGKKDRLPFTPEYIEDYFSIAKYVGNSSVGIAVTTGINFLSASDDGDGTEGGLTWIKRVDTDAYHYFLTKLQSSSHDYFSGKEYITPSLNSGNLVATNFQDTINGDTSAGIEWDSDGFTGLNSNIVADSFYTSYNFKPKKKFFDIVTYVGNGSWQAINHNLDAVPGCIIVKSLTDSDPWYTYHRVLDGADGSNANERLVKFSSNEGWETDATIWKSTTPTDTQFWVQGSSSNANGSRYVAYLFAHDERAFGDLANESVVYCGAWFTNEAAGNFTELGWEPQLVLYKSAQNGVNWQVFDNLSGVFTGNRSYGMRMMHNRQAENDRTEGTGSGGVSSWPAFYPTGFQLMNNGGQSGIYIAIRKPMKVPERGTQVFSEGRSRGAAIVTPFDTANLDMRHIDMYLHKNTNADGSNDNWELATRDMGVGSGTRGTWRFVKPDTESAQQTNGTSNDGAWINPTNYGYTLPGKGYSTDFYSFMFQSGRKSFERVAYHGADGTNDMTIKHGLGQVPEFIIARAVNNSAPFYIYHKDLGTNKYLTFNPDAAITSTTLWQNSAPTLSEYYVGGNLGLADKHYIGLLFGTLAGVSKVGSYSGSSSNITVDCGFKDTARFVMIKRSDVNSANWYIFSKGLGITDGSVAMPQALYTTAGNFSWTCPEGVTSVSVVCVGGGGGGYDQAGSNFGGGAGGSLGWKNNISVTPGQSYPLQVGAAGPLGAGGGHSWFIDDTTVKGGGGQTASNGGWTVAYVGDGGGNGGAGQAGNGADGAGGSGGGAGGYSGAGGAAGNDGSGGGGAGGGDNGSGNSQRRAGGGGVGLYGEGTSGTCPSGSGDLPLGGGGGSGGGDGGQGNGGGGAGGQYGGGAGGGYSGGVGGGGAVRIMWSTDGTTRAFPSTNATQYKEDKYLTLNNQNKLITSSTVKIDPSSSGFIIPNGNVSDLNTPSGTYIYLAIA